MDSAGAGIVEMLYNWLFYGVIHDAMGSYAHFHDAPCEGACSQTVSLYI